MCAQCTIAQPAPCPARFICTPNADLPRHDGGIQEGSICAGSQVQCKKNRFLHLELYSNYEFCALGVATARAREIVQV